MQIDFYQQACERIEDEAESKPGTLDDYLENDLSNLALYARVMANSIPRSDEYQNAYDRVRAIQSRAIEARIAEEADQLASEMEAEYYDYLRDAEIDAQVDRMLQDQAEAA